MYLIKKEVVVVENFSYNYVDGTTDKAFLDQHDKMFLCWYRGVNKTLEILELPKILDEMQKEFERLEKNLSGETNNRSNIEARIEVGTSIDILNEIVTLLKS